MRTGVTVVVVLLTDALILAKEPPTLRAVVPLKNPAVFVEHDIRVIPENTGIRVSIVAFRSEPPTTVRTTLSLLTQLLR
jgi:hypothetical protein